MNYTQYNHACCTVFCVDMRDEKTKPWSSLALRGIKKYLTLGKKIAFLVGKKGYAAGTICNDCGHIPHCDNCDVPIAVHHTHSGQKIGLCHICRHEYSVDAECNKCGGTDTTIFGLGAQQVVDWIQEQYGVSALLLETSTVKSIPKISRLQTAIHSTQVIVGTSLLSQKIEGWTPDLFVIVNADIGLHVPDFQARWNNFTLLYDCFKNVGAKHYIVQTYNPDTVSIRQACSMGYESMQQAEQAYRKEYHYPPYAQMCVIHYKHEIEEKLFSTTNKLFQELLYLKQTYEMNAMEIYTTPPMIYKMYGKYRYTIIIKGPTVREFMEIAYSKLSMNTRGFKIDWEPQQLL